MKTSKITTCRFTSEWKNPKGGTVYYHELTMQNGDIGNIGTMEKLPHRISEGKEVEYEIDTNTHKIKIIQAVAPIQQSAPAKPVYQNNNYSNQNKMTYSKKPDDFIGYIMGYAKDIVCAKISAKQKIENDSEETIKIARELFIEVKKMLSEQ